MGDFCPTAKFSTVGRCKRLVALFFREGGPCLRCGCKNQTAGETRRRKSNDCNGNDNEKGSSGRSGSKASPKKGRSHSLRSRWMFHGRVLFLHGMRGKVVPISSVRTTTPLQAMAAARLLLRGCARGTWRGGVKSYCASYDTNFTAGRRGVGTGR
jgi:hypothetical protein